MVVQSFYMDTGTHPNSSQREYILSAFEKVLAYRTLTTMSRQVATMAIKGTSFHEDRGDLVRMVRECIGKKVRIDLKEDHEDVDMYNYGNTKYGSITVMDADSEWRLVHIETPKGNKDKLIRMESIEGISIVKE